MDTDSIHNNSGDRSRYSLWLILALMAASAIIGFDVSRRIFDKHVIENRDTIERLVTNVRVDTIRKYVPMPIDTRFVDRVVIYHDTIHDAVVSLPVSQVEYSDSAYHAWVSGYEPRLDSIHIFRPTITKTIERNITKTIKPRITHGIQFGAYLTPKGIQPGIGYGLTINL